MTESSPPNQAAPCSCADRAVAAALGFAAFAAVLASTGHYGMCWDEGLYWPAYRDVAAWIGTLFTHPGEALSNEGILAGWETIRELPPLVKFLEAIPAGLAPAKHMLLALRLVPAALFGATVAFIFLLARRRASASWAILVAVTYALHPRLFGDAHFAASETPFAFLTVLIFFVADGDMARWPRRIALVVLAGLAIATKVNGIILLVVLLSWLILRPWTDRNAGHNAKHALFLSILLLAGAPLVAFLVWPWMWHDTGTRLAEYWSFIHTHRHYGLWYLGEKWVLPPGSELRVPWHYPIVMTLVASPIVWLALVAAGIALLARSAFKERRLASFDLLLILSAGAPIAALMMPSAPKYDGLRLFLPAFAPLTLLSIHAAAAIPEKARSWAPRALIILLAFSLPAGWRDGLGYYNLPTRLIASKGTDFPFETTYWGECLTPEVFDDIAAHFGTQDVHIKTLAIDPAALLIQQEWGTLPSGFRFDGDPPYDAHLMLNRKGFWSRTEWWFAANREPLLTWPRGSDNPRLYLFTGAAPGVPD